MGINLIIACHEHRVYSYSMRGEEPWDVQWWFRYHGDCFERGKIDVYRDADYYPGDGGLKGAEDYGHAWEYELRPARGVKV